MHIGGSLIEVDPNRAEELDPSRGLEAIRVPQFPTKEAEAAWRQDCQLAIDRQAFAWAVAPNCEFRGPKSGLLLTAGAEVVPGRDMSFPQIHTLHRRGVILRGTPEGKRVAACPSNARYAVAPNQAITSSEGQLLAGAEVLSEWLEGGEQALLSLVHRGIVIDRTTPAVSQLPAEVALRAREADLENASAAVQAAKNALKVRDDESTQEAFLKAKGKLDLASAHVELAKEAVVAESEASAKRQRLELARRIDELETQIKAREGEVGKFDTAAIGFAIKLADILRAKVEYEDGTFQLKIQRNAREAELQGREPRFENPPLNHRLHQQIQELARIVTIDPRHLMERHL